MQWKITEIVSFRLDTHTHAAPCRPENRRKEIKKERNWFYIKISFDTKLRKVNCFLSSQDFWGHAVPLKSQECRENMLKNVETVIRKAAVLVCPYFEWWFLSEVIVRCTMLIPIFVNVCRFLHWLEPSTYVGYFC